MPVRWLIVCVVLLCPSLAAAQDALPLADDVKLEVLRDQSAGLVKALIALKAPLPTDDAKELQAASTAEKLQEILDRRCLFGVTINPESRVKGTRGAAAIELQHDRPVYVLIKVLNDAGVTAPLKIEGPQLREAGKHDPGRWLEAAVMTEAPLTAKLSGQRVDYVVLRLIAREAGKREATFRFDVGQGTQDLGFQAEVPVLFTVRGSK